MFTGIGLFYWSGRLTTRQQYDLEQRLDRIETLEAIAPLVDVLSTDARSELPQLRRVVARLLRQVSPADARYLPAPQRAALYNILTQYHLNTMSAELVTAILYAFEQLSDSKALPHTKRLAECRPWTPTQRQMQREAEQILIRLTLRQEDLQMRNMLVRASETPVSGADVLVRPASQKAFDRPEQLLRATSDEQN